MGQKRAVLIIGGGVAGLTAAMRLAADGCTVTVLEGRDRLGGRIHTVRDGALPVELGAEFVHGKNPTLFQLIKDAQLSTSEVSDRNRVWRDGALADVPIWERISEIIARIPPDGADSSFQEFIDRLTIDPVEREMALGFVKGFDAADPGLASAQGLLWAERSAEKQEGDAQARLDLGYGALVGWLEETAQERGAVLMMGILARHVRWRHGHVEVQAEVEGRIRTWEADALLVTLPLGVLKRGDVVFDPELREKMDVVHAFAFGNARKLALIFDEVWWPGERDFGFVHAFNEPFPTWWSNSRGPFLTGWAGGPKADVLVGKSEAELVSLGVEALSRIFSEPESRVRGRLRRVYTYDWAADPLARGAYSYIPVGGLDLPRQFSEPVQETIFYAGEAAVRDGQMGTVFGAVESGLRAAGEITRGRASEFRTCGCRS